MNRSLARLALSTGVSLALVAPAFAAPAAGNSANFNSGCVVSALGARKTALASAISSQGAAVAQREDALIAAWSLSDAAAREAAIKTAHKTYKGTWKTFAQSLKDARKNFRSAMKACNVNPSSLETSSGISNGF